MSEIFTITGLILSGWGSYILIQHMFITDEEIKETEEIPIDTSNTRVGFPPGNIIVSDPEILKNFRKNYLKARIDQRKNGKFGLMLLIFGFLFQAVVPLLKLFA